jgi:hypothetical protein
VGGEREIGLLLEQLQEVGESSAVQKDVQFKRKSLKAGNRFAACSAKIVYQRNQED